MSDERLVQVLIHAIYLVVGINAIIIVGILLAPPDNDIFGFILNLFSGIWGAFIGTMLYKKIKEIENEKDN